MASSVKNTLKLFVFIVAVLAAPGILGTGIAAALRVPWWHAPARPVNSPHGNDDGGCFFKAIYNLGDSLSDTGNLVREGGGAGGTFYTISRFPYGKDALDGRPTGRCSDGLLMIDYLAQDLGLPLLQPYLNKEANFTGGVNFAVAGATALPASFFPAHKIIPPFTASSLDVQLGRFRDHVNSTFSSESESREMFERTLFMLGEIGSNDFIYGLLAGKSIDDLKAYVPDVVAKIMDVGQQLIDMGAKHIVVPGNFPMGCFPMALTTFSTNDTSAYDARGCLKDLNNFAVYQNFHLKNALEGLRLSNMDKGVTIMYGDYYQAFMLLMRGAIRFGFDQASLLQSCCGSPSAKYRIGITSMCGMPGSDVCYDPSRFISWDGIHLTQQAFRVMEKILTVGGLISTPDGCTMKKWMCPKSL